METSTLYKTLQKILKNNPTIIVGSGASIEVGLPGMPELTQHIKESCKVLDGFDHEKFIETIENDNNIEKSLSNINYVKYRDDFLKIVWNYISSKDIEFIKTIGNKKLPMQVLLEYLASSDNKLINIITTNYDRMIELAGESTRKLFVDNSFLNGRLNGTGTDNNINIKYKSSKSQIKTLNILKVHGSIDYFQNSKDEVICCDPHYKQDDFKTLIIPPTYDKHEKAHESPFRNLIARADKIIHDSQSIIFIGFGFNDSHIQDPIKNFIKNPNNSIIVITKKLSENIKEMCQNMKQDKCFLIEETVNGSNIWIPSNIGIDHFDPLFTEQSIWNLEGFNKHVLGESNE